jgi:hypothetical protein
MIQRLISRAIGKTFSPQRYEWSCWEAKRNFSEKVVYYDSQSGQHVSFSNSLSVHALIRESSPEMSIPEGIASLTLPHGSIPPSRFDSTLCPMFFTVAPGQPQEFSEISAVSIELNLSAPRAAWDETLMLMLSFRSKGVDVKVILRGCLEVEPEKVGLAACLVADAGVGLIMVEVSAAENIDEDLSDIWEVLVGCDVAGVPMKNRIGIRLVNGVEVDCALTKKILAEAILSHEIKHVDASLDSAECTGTTISLQTTVQALREIRVPSTLRIDF